MVRHGVTVLALHLNTSELSQDDSILVNHLISWELAASGDSYSISLVVSVRPNPIRMNRCEIFDSRHQF
jgi:hypothetical protein